MKMVLVLEDGTLFEGDAFGAEREICGWVHNDYGVVGYQETLTDPGNRGALVNMTYPLIGNYGVNSEDGESDRAQAAALLVKERSLTVSNWRAEGSLDEWMKGRGVVGMEGVDTRTLALHLRERGEMRGVIAPAASSVQELLEKIRAYVIPKALELIGEAVSTGGKVETFADDGRYRVAVCDLGVRKSCLAQLQTANCQVIRTPATTRWEEISILKPEGLLIAGGPGDPRELTDLIAQIRKALGKLPIAGVGMGCQLLALAGGGRIGTMKTGHHGVNYPVRETASGRDAITIQNHHFVIEADSLAGSDFRVSHMNLNDGSVEGVVAGKYEAAGVQFVPVCEDDGAPGALFKEFVGRMERRRNAEA
jgi:carbamoyl-phosphate synthase small subunit